MKTSDWQDKALELSPGFFKSFSTCVVLAPHPDDESLGCGGLIAMLRDMKKEVFVIFITDGSMSHPNSQKYPAEALSQLRKEEAKAALLVLQVPNSNVLFLNKKDGSLPANGEAFTHNAVQLKLLLALLQPDLVLVPYEKDPHPDHRATWQMLMEERHAPELNYTILEYLIWLHERGETEDMPSEKDLRFVNIAPFQKEKDEAIHKHLSQTTRFIDDDPEGFILSPQVLSHFSGTKEYYLDRHL